MVKKVFLYFILFTGIILSQKLPENIIILIGDGMGLDYVSANVVSDKDNPFVKFTSIGLSLTSSAKNLITDSGAGATALSTGYRSYNHAIGVDTLQKPLLNLLELAERSGKNSGVIATGSVTDATPASFLAHVADRQYETEIARQTYYGDADVVIGGGRSFFSSAGKGGRQIETIDYIDSMKNRGYNYFEDLKNLRNIKPDKPLFILLENKGLKPAGERDYGLADMVSAALNYFTLSKKGFVLMVEGSQIDWAAHDNKTSQMLKEIDDFTEAVNTALDFAGKNKNTLVIVTSDHETGGGSLNGGNLDGTDLDIEFNTTGHTAGMVGIFAKGPGEENFRCIMPNNYIARKLFRLLDPGYKFH